MLGFFQEFPEEPIYIFLYDFCTFSTMKLLLEFLAGIPAGFFSKNLYRNSGNVSRNFCRDFSNSAFQHYSMELATILCLSRDFPREFFSNFSYNCSRKPCCESFKNLIFFSDIPPVFYGISSGTPAGIIPEILAGFLPGMSIGAPLEMYAEIS